MRRPKRVKIAWSTGRSKERTVEEDEEEMAEVAEELLSAHAALAEAQAELAWVQLKMSKMITRAGGVRVL